MAEKFDPWSEVNNSVVNTPTADPWAQVNAGPVDPIKSRIYDTGPQLRDQWFYQDFTNAMIKGLVSTPQQAFYELAGNHEKAKEIQQYYDENYYTDPREWSTTIGGVTGSIIPTIGAVASTLAPEPVSTAVGGSYLAYMTTQAMGAGLGAARDYEDATGTKLSTTQKATITAGYGIVTLLSERIGLHNLSGQLIKNNPQMIQTLGELYLKGDKKALVRNTAHLLDNAVISGVTIEGPQEATEQIAHNVIDKFMYDDERGILDGALQSYGFGVVGGGMVGTTTGMINLYGNNQITELANEENVSIQTMKDKIWKVASPMERKIADEHADGFNFLTEKYMELKKLYPFAEQGKTQALDKAETDLTRDAINNGIRDLDMDVGQELTENEVIAKIKKDGSYKIYNPDHYNRSYESSKDFFWVGPTIIHIPKGATKAQIKSIIASVEFIRQKAPKMLSLVQDINFQADGQFITDKNNKNKSANTGGYFRRDKPGVLFVRTNWPKHTIQSGKVLTSAEMVNTIVHEMTHNRDFLKYGVEKYEAMFLDDQNRGSQELPWGEYKNLKGEARAFALGDLAGQLYSNIVSRAKGTLINEAHEKGIPYNDATGQALIEQQMYDAIQELHRVYVNAKIPTSEFIKDLAISIKNDSWVNDILNDLAQKGEIIWDSNILNRVISVNSPTMSNPQVNTIVALINSWSKMVAKKTDRSPDDVLNSYFSQTGTLPRSGVSVKTFSDDAKIFIDALRSSGDTLGGNSFKDSLASLVGIFEKTLSESDKRVIEEWAGIDKESGGRWSKKRKEKFANAFVRWLRQGYSENADLDNIFKDTKKQLTDIYKTVRGTDIDVNLTPGIRKVFENMLSSQNLDDQLQEGWLASVGLHQAQGWLNQIMDTFDIESTWERLGARDVGTRIKTYFSRQGAEIEAGLKVVQDVYRLFKFDGNKVTDAILYYESRDTFDKDFGGESKIVRAPYERAFEILDEYFGGKLEDLKKNNILQQGFVQSLQQQLLDQIGSIQEELDGLDAGIESKKRRELVDTYKEHIRQLEESIDNLKYVHIPATLWFLKHAGNNGQVFYKTLNWLSAKERKTFKIQDLIDTGIIDRNDVLLSDIIHSYSSRIGQDLALADILNAAKQNGMAITEKMVGGADERMEKFPNYEKCNSKASVLKGWFVTPELNTFFTEFTSPKGARGLFDMIDSGFAKAKMMQFINPFFLPFYDLHQQMWTGLWSPTSILSGTFHRAWIGGIKSYFAKDENWYNAEKYGARSTPYANPYEDVNQWYEDVTTHIKVGDKYIGGNPLLNSIFRAFNPNKDPRKIFGDLYNCSWNLAWTMDGVIRQVTYQYLLDKGIAKDEMEAAQTAALFHGDYAGVPMKTRQSLNRVFFTPTFKIAMAKVYTRMIKGAFKSGGSLIGKVTNTGIGSTTTKNDINMGKGIVRGIVALTAFDMLMKSLGFEEEDKFRRYKKTGKDIVDESGKPKELVLTFSSPLNMFKKYIDRATTTFKDSGESNKVGSYLSKHKYELHPLWRIGWNLTNNSTDTNEPIYLNFDSEKMKRHKMLMYASHEILSVLKTFKDEYGDDKHARDKLRQDVGYIYGMSEAFETTTFAYLRELEPIRNQRRITNMERELTNDIKSFKDALSKGETISEDVMVEVIQTFEERLLGLANELIALEPHSAFEKLLETGYGMPEPMKSWWINKVSQLLNKPIPQNRPNPNHDPWDNVK